MKYIKTFENIFKKIFKNYGNQPNNKLDSYNTPSIINLLPEGSEVILLYINNNNNLDKYEEDEREVNDIFTIVEVDKNDIDEPYYILNEYFLGWVKYDQIRLATQEEIDQYELKELNKKSEKYNL